MTQKKKLWITYAWLDNEDLDVDFVIQELEARDLDVHYDRLQLLSGRRLWDQIDAAINDEELAGWAIYLTKNSLESEPCQEELAYALDRALRVRSGGFPLIGLFPEPMDRQIIPSAIATRLYVNLQDNDWAQKVTDGLVGASSHQKPKSIRTYGIDFHDFNGRQVVELWPRTGTWAPFFVAVPKSEDGIVESLCHGPRGYISGTCQTARIVVERRSYSVIAIQNEITSNNSAHIFLNGMPSELRFGSLIDASKQYTVQINKT